MIAAFVLAQTVVFGVSPPGIFEARERMMVSIEARVVMPPGAAPLASYERLYTTDQNGDVVALYRRSEQPGRRWVSARDLPLISDGGCAFIDVRVSTDPDAPVHASCHGEA